MNMKHVDSFKHTDELDTVGRLGARAALTLAPHTVITAVEAAEVLAGLATVSGKEAAPWWCWCLEVGLPDPRVQETPWLPTKQVAASLGVERGVVDALASWAVNHCPEGCVQVGQGRLKKHYRWHPERFPLALKAAREARDKATAVAKPPAPKTAKRQPKKGEALNLRAIGREVLNERG